MKIPLATYRLQFNPGFGFEDARKIISYLADLGISDVYASPIFRAKAGSSHGYDVVDMNQLSPDLGSGDEFEMLISDIKNAGMGWLQDIVPNHMAFNGENQILMDVLENGHNSEYYGFFDIEWSHFYENLSDRLLAPFLGRHYSESLDAREITLRYDQHGFSINHFTMRLPLKIESYATVMTHRLKLLREKLGDDHPDLIKFLGILYSLKSLPETEEERLGRYSQIQFVKRMLWETYQFNDDIKEFIDGNVKIYNGEGESESDLNLLDSLLSEQHYRLAFWKVATEELNYRRFFNINNLISVRVEDTRVFKWTHSLIFKLVKEKKITGLRIDHIDGLYDPSGYLRKLKEVTDDIYITVEKILELDEDLPSLWAVQGTTGYDFLNYVNGLFCDERNGSRFNKLYYGFTGLKTSFDVLFYEKKKLVIEREMTGDVDNLAHLLKKISGKSRYGNDMTLYGLKEAIIEILAHFPVYRTYIRHDHYSDADRRYITEALKRAKDMNPALLYEISFIELFLLLEFGDLPEEDRKAWLHFVMRFQQQTGPLMAKGFEDTILYVYNRLLSLNDVGGSPDRFGISETEFHEFNIKRSRRQPHSMNATSTHDSKRGEDIRARINALSEIPDLWETSLKKWSKLNRRKKKTLKGVTIPDKNDEYFLYQTLVGAYPFDSTTTDEFKGRVGQYIIKAVREAKVHTAWLKPDSDYEDNYLNFINKILEPSDDNQFLKEFLDFQSMISFYGVFNSLSQTLVKITSPGFPDFYQGTELWDLSFVDPDNRRPVDFDRRRGYLSNIKERCSTDVQGLMEELLSAKGDGRIKLFLIYRALSAMQRYRSFYEKGEYMPLETEGKYKENLISFARIHRPHCSITIVPRFLTGVVGEGEYPFGRHVWDDTRIILPDNSMNIWKDEISGQEIEGKGFLYAGDAMEKFPVSLLTGTVNGH
jgi:(1->4)-alpha-D-glucan 1-alpha-D-glucosylmutase